MLVFSTAANIGCFHMLPNCYLYLLSRTCPQEQSGFCASCASDGAPKITLLNVDPFLFLVTVLQFHKYVIVKHLQTSPKLSFKHAKFGAIHSADCSHTTDLAKPQTGSGVLGKGYMLKHLWLYSKPHISYICIQNWIWHQSNNKSFWFS